MTLFPMGAFAVVLIVSVILAGLAWRKFRDDRGSLISSLAATLAGGVIASLVGYYGASASVTQSKENYTRQQTVDAHLAFIDAAQSLQLLLNNNVPVQLGPNPLWNPDSALPGEKFVPGTLRLDDQAVRDLSTRGRDLSVAYQKVTVFPARDGETQQLAFELKSYLERTSTLLFQLDSTARVALTTKSVLYEEEFRRLWGMLSSRYGFVGRCHVDDNAACRADLLEKQPAMSRKFMDRLPMTYLRWTFDATSQTPAEKSLVESRSPSTLIDDLAKRIREEASR
ncbi:Uncharacterised protein (plasmid) [Tsukamurella tyrosinosolvens]|uniref:Uncharacterized protein n=1 Tax=Tsukamurella tyrosinosolvens TaxID=57704 RepID=A0A1H4WKU3_TSUTY|nr:hypothetical protein [Tsukamurella tyrosinosolvens]KXO99662.1 hypothetical protein AXK58_00060 [Tsukamurella tyrosinosolvens]SEC93937.1 hypothetical protein SAMN04489793_3596 [Tsukamurella tyrosinosolvens]VEH89422.1 Uncharacterised protein [Tsukamurella tyrosinosolvens]